LNTTALKAVSKPAPTSSTGAGSAAEEIAPRRSEELVIALSGPLGCGLPDVLEVVKQSLEARAYTVVVVKLSRFFPLIAKALEPSAAIDDLELSQLQGYKRYRVYQELGNKIRGALGADAAAQLAMSFISQDRADKHPKEKIDEIDPGKVAYIIDQLKRPEEASVLKDVYGDMFFLIGVLCGEEKRKRNLLKEMSAPNAEELVEIDRSENQNPLGQRLEKTLQRADFFVRNSHSNRQQLETPISRFLDLLHGRNGLTPTLAEHGMFAAHSAGLRSACLSRQVGAAILDVDGNVISVGCNDVPKSGGGLYQAKMLQETGDHRCVFLEGGKCFNDEYKDHLKSQIRQVLVDNGIDSLAAARCADAIRGKTRLRDLIEFSRSVHAEMDAIVQVARNGGVSIRGGILFTTTYPCHNCARHIVAAGIRAVYFIEPYEKSLAEALHSDAIDHEPEEDPDFRTPFVGQRVAFLHFEGVAPNRYKDLFEASERKKDGKAILTPVSQAEKKAPEFLDNYKQLEARIIARLVNKGLGVSVK
jgi:deoxycytidylate deaminase